MADGGASTDAPVKCGVSNWEGWYVCLEDCGVAAAEHGELGPMLVVAWALERTILHSISLIPSSVCY